MSLQSYTVRTWMTPAPDTVSPDATLLEARRQMDRGDFRHLPVVEDREVIGIISDRDLRSALPTRKTGDYDRSLDTADLPTVGAIMCHNPVTVSPNTPVAEAARLLIDLQIGAVPVVLDGEIVGIFSEVDGLQALISALMYLKEIGRSGKLDDLFDDELEDDLDDDLHEIDEDDEDDEELLDDEDEDDEDDEDNDLIDDRTDDHP